MTDRLPPQPSTSARVQTPLPGFVLEPPPTTGFVTERPPRVINFEGRRITVPADTTDAELEQILNGSPAQAPARPHGLPIEIEAPDGTIVEFPADTTDAEIVEVMRREYGGPASQALPSSTGLPGGFGPRAGREGMAGPALAPRLVASPSTFGMFDQADADSPMGPPVDQPGAQSGATAQAGSQGAWRSMADTVGLVPDIVNMGANAVLASTDFASRKLGGPELPFRFPMTSDEIAKQASKAAPALGIPLQDPDKMSEPDRLAYNTARFGGQAALTAGVAAPVAAARGAGAVNQAPKVGHTFLKPYADAPVKTTVGDTIAGAGGGAGLTAAQSVPDEVRQAGGGVAGLLLDLAGMATGQVGGGTIASAALHGPGHVADRVTKNLPARDVRVDPDTGMPVSNAVADQAARFVQSETTDPRRAAQKIKEGAAAFRDMDAPVPTSGALSNDPKLMALERGQRRLEPGQFAERDRALRDAALDTMDEVRPKGVEPRDATTFLAGERDRRVSGAAGALRTAEAGLATAEAGERSLADVFRTFSGRGSEASRNLDEVVTGQALVPAQRQKNQLYASIDPERNVMRDVEPMVTLAGDISQQVAELPASLQREMIPQQLINDIRAMARRTEQRTVTSPLLNEFGQPMSRTENVTVGGTGQMSFGSMNEMRSGLSSAATAARKAGSYRLAENLDRFRTLISRESEALAAEGTPAGERARAASENYRENFAPVWNRGPGDEAVRFRKDFNTDQANRTTTPPTATASRFLTTGPGAQEKAGSLARVVQSMANPGDQASATAAVRQFVMSDLTKTIGADGRINPQQLARWLNGPSGWNDALGSFPGVQAEAQRLLTDVMAGQAQRNRMAAEVERAASGLKRTQSELNSSALSLVIGREPTKAARAVLESQDPQMAMREIREAIGGNKAVLPAWERAVTDHLTDRITSVDPAGVSAGERSINYAKLVKTFDRYKGALSELYAGQPEKMNALVRVQKMLEPLAKQSGPASTAAPMRNEHPDVWKLLEVGLKAHYGILKGGGVLRTLKLASSFGSDEAVQAQRLVTRMMFDAELASHLLTRQVKEVGTPAWNDKLAKLLRRVEMGREAFSSEE